ncbi:hypothetical protein [Paenibacillus sp. HJGM_3]|uniref:hypothetical protein n=1 Tax=Paenibacillus sp. HJGM_3 TaxID=3379816 RepID=UPI00385BFBFD
MEAHPYYVSVQAGTILDNQGDAAYEFQINATEEEVSYLHNLLMELQDWEKAIYLRAPLPSIPYHDDEENVGYDSTLKKIYAYIHKLGDEEAKRTIDAMDLDRLGTPYPTPPETEAPSESPRA